MLAANKVDIIIVVFYQPIFLILGIHTQASYMDQLNEQMTTRNYSSWHDHAAIASHSMYLATIKQLYDSLMYLTQEEYTGWVITVVDIRDGIMNILPCHHTTLHTKSIHKH